ncbi:hypothetical protein [Burkholderia plantarii]|uniref:hypothetical protein n=1 Tax=Burkholderia plantarii TaxID=41899 RepID=UPI000870875B|nr:hypothetical protein [Burkholderia plantarii]
MKITRRRFDSRPIELVIVFALYFSIYASIQSLQCPSILDAFHASQFGAIYVILAALTTGAIVVRAVFLLLSLARSFVRNPMLASRLFLLILFLILTTPIAVSALAFPWACRYF